MNWQEIELAKDIEMKCKGKKEYKVHWDHRHLQADLMQKKSRRSSSSTSSTSTMSNKWVSGNHKLNFHKEERKEKRLNEMEKIKENAIRFIRKLIEITRFDTIYRTTAPTITTASQLKSILIICNSTSS